MDLLLLRNLVAHASQAALLTLGAVLLAHALRRLHPQFTLTMWQGLLVAMVILPFAEPRTPASYHLFLSESVVGAGGPGSSPEAPAFVIPGTVLSIIGTVLVLGVATRLAWLGAGLWQLRRLSERTPVLQEMPDAIRAAMLDSGAHATFRQSNLQGPVSFGLRRGVVLLPSNFAALDGRAQYLVGLHELLHVRRRDALQSLLEEALVALFWYYPWAWWIRGRIRLAREQVVDRATAGGARQARVAYIRTLLRFAGHNPRPLPTASGMWRAHELRARIDALNKEVTMSRSRTLVAAAGALVVLGAVAVAAASAFPLYSPSLPTAPRIGPTQTTAMKADRIGFQQSSQDDEAVRIGGDVKPPKKVKDVQPVYPPDAREARIQGEVIVETVINKEGKVASAEVVRSVPELDQAALDAVLQWEFEPTYIKGKAVSVRMAVTFNFKLQ